MARRVARLDALGRKVLIKYSLQSTTYEEEEEEKAKSTEVTA